MEAFSVLVRCKPSPSPVVQVSPGQVSIPEMRGLCRAHSFSFEEVFVGSTAELYREGVQTQVKRLAAGRNYTCLAYGATGAGKTHTMFGSLYHQTVSEAGVVALALRDAMEVLERPTLSYLEIYNERVNDLLGQEDNLPLHEDTRGVSVPGLTALPVSSYEAALDLVRQGNCRRKQAHTKANAHSSRSHALLTLASQDAKLHLLDLAGSERAQSEAARATEGSCINKSLLTLGNCLTMLASHKAAAFVPYRDSKLTRLLKDSLGGGALTTFIACITPTAAALEETLQTLKYAQRAQHIQVKERKEDRWLAQRRLLAELQENTASRRERCKDEAPFLLRVSDSLRHQVALLDRLLGKENRPETRLRQQLQRTERLGEEKDRVIAALTQDVHSLRTHLQPRGVEVSPLRLRLSSLAALRRAHKEAKCLGRSQSLGGLN